MTDFETVSRRIANKLVTIEQTKMEFTEGTATNGWFHTLSWSESLFEAVAMEEVLRQCMVALSFYRDTAEEAVCRAADFPYPLTPSYTRFEMFKRWLDNKAGEGVDHALINARSTMAVSNTLHHCLAAAWIKVGRGLAKGDFFYF